MKALLAFGDVRFFVEAETFRLLCDEVIRCLAPLVPLERKTICLQCSYEEYEEAVREEIELLRDAGAEVEEVVGGSSSSNLGLDGVRSSVDAETSRPSLQNSHVSLGGADSPSNASSSSGRRAARGLRSPSKPAGKTYVFSQETFEAVEGRVRLYEAAAEARAERLASLGLRDLQGRLLLRRPRPPSASASTPTTTTGNSTGGMDQAATTGAQISHPQRVLQRRPVPVLILDPYVSTSTPIAPLFDEQGHSVRRRPSLSVSASTASLHRALTQAEGDRSPSRHDLPLVLTESASAKGSVEVEDDSSGVKNTCVPLMERHTPHPVVHTQAATGTRNSLPFLTTTTTAAAARGPSAQQPMVHSVPRPRAASALVSITAAATGAAGAVGGPAAHAPRTLPRAAGSATVVPSSRRLSQPHPRRDTMPSYAPYLMDLYAKGLGGGGDGLVQGSSPSSRRASVRSRSQSGGDGGGAVGALRAVSEESDTAVATRLFRSPGQPRSHSPSLATPQHPQPTHSVAREGPSNMAHGATEAGEAASYAFFRARTAPRAATTSTVSSADHLLPMEYRRGASAAASRGGDVLTDRDCRLMSDLLFTTDMHPAPLRPMAAPGPDPLPPPSLTHSVHHRASPSPDAARQPTVFAATPTRLQENRP